MSNIKRILSSIKESPFEKKIACRHTVYFIYNISSSNNNENFRIASEYCTNLIKLHSIKEIPWKGILSRNLRVANIPPKNAIKSFSDYIKRKLLRILMLNVEPDILICYTHNAIFCETENSLYTPAKHIRSIFTTNVPHFKCYLLLNLQKQYLKDLFDTSKNITHQDDSAGIAIFCQNLNKNLIEAYRRLHPKKKIILRLYDALPYNHPEILNPIITKISNLKLEGLIDNVESYCKLDARKFNFIYRPNGVNPKFFKKLETNYRSFLFQFVGYSNTSKSSTNKRLRPLTEIVAMLQRIYPEISKYLRAKTVDTKMYKEYPQYAEEMAKSEIYLDLLRINQDEGYSYRIPEAIILNRKIITNRIAILSEDFYSPDRVFVIGHDSLDRLQSFLEADIAPLPEHIRNRYDSTLWWTDKDPYTTKLETSK